VGSRSSSADTTFNDQGEDAAGYGFPPPLSYVFNLTNIAEGGTPITNRNQYINQSGMAEGLVGGDLPVVIYYYPVDGTLFALRADTADDALTACSGCTPAGALELQEPTAGRAVEQQPLLDHGRQPGPRHERLARADSVVPVCAGGVCGA
jgi:hypothetical protein